jgi:hypothetical protein
MAKQDTMQVVQKLYQDGRVEDCAARLTLEELQGFVGGDIELVACRIAHRSLVVNETGALEQLPINRAATALAQPGVLMDGGIRGPALLVKR